jgi:hypothetical protein
LKSGIVKLYEFLEKLVITDFENGELPRANQVDDIDFDRVDSRHKPFAMGSIALADNAFKKITGFNRPLQGKWLDGFLSDANYSNIASTPAGFATAVTIDGILLYLSLGEDYRYLGGISTGQEAIDYYVRDRFNFMIDLLRSIQARCDDAMLQGEIEAFIAAMVNEIPGLDPGQEEMINETRGLGGGNQGRAIHSQVDQIQERWLKIAGLLRG